MACVKLHVRFQFTIHHIQEIPAGRFPVRGVVWRRIMQLPSLVYFPQLLLVVLEVLRVVRWVAQERQDVLNRDVVVIVDEEIKFTANAEFLTPSKAA